MGKQKDQTSGASADEANTNGNAGVLQTADAGVDGAAVTESPPGGGDSGASASRSIQARVLAHCTFGEPNDVIEIDEDLAATMTDVVDIHPEAVAYALSISKE